MEATKTFGQDTAVQEGFELALHEPGPVRAPRLRRAPLQERFEVLLQYLVKYALLGVSPFVLRAGMGCLGMGHWENRPYLFLR